MHIIKNLSIAFVTLALISLASCKTEDQVNTPPGSDPDTVELFDRSSFSISMPDSARIGDTFSLVFHFRTLESGNASCRVFMGLPGVPYDNTNVMQILSPTRDSIGNFRAPVGQPLGYSYEFRTDVVANVSDSISLTFVAGDVYIVDNIFRTTGFRVAMAIDSLYRDGELIHVHQKYPGVFDGREVGRIDTILVYR